MSNIISVGQFNNYIHDILNAEDLLHNIEIYGEVSGIKYSGNAVYFSIKDETAILSCVQFGLYGNYQPKEGDMVLVRGSPNYYIKGGRFSFNVNKITPYGQGVLYQQFLLLKEKLQNMGLFDESRKKSLPKIIKRVGVVTSETGAVIHDIIDVSHRRNPFLDIVLYPAKVQGIGADITIIEGIKQLQTTNVDVIIIARGGGSMEDLNCFNSEALAMAIANCKKPIISAVGHEVDFTIADFVADLRAPTPSAAAEIISSDIANLSKILEKNTIRLNNYIDRFFIDKFEDLNYFYDNIINIMNGYISKKYQFLITLFQKLDYSTKLVITNINNRFDKVTQQLESMNPVKILKLGYAMAITKDNKVIKNIKKVNIGDNINLKLENGTLSCKVLDKRD